MAKKYYAVIQGKEGTGIYRDWPTTEENVKGISGVKHKAFPDEESAVSFITGHGVSRDKIQLFYPEETKGSDKLKGGPRRVKTKGKEEIILEGSTITAYVDGSFRRGYSVYGYGVVILYESEVIETISGFGLRPEYVSMRNVAGEILGAVKAMQYAMDKGVRELILHFDYQGIENWARGTWKRNNDLTRGYHDFAREAAKKIKLTFKKVKGHSGDPFNDLADALAKEAVVSSDN